MSNYELAKTYNPSEHEPGIYAAWEKSGAFTPDGNKAIQKSDKAPFSIILPPPNANGNLHTGHAMFVVEDIMARYRRMQGHPTLWLPGMDHAGIETQVVYERELQKIGKGRYDLGREEFYCQVDAFTRGNMGNMTAQLKSLGFSLDWSKLTYTLDDSVVETVYDTFKRLHDDGLIYRGNRIVNWCPFCRSAFADIEVKYREQMDPLYYIKYGPFVLATVRPETKFGDTAIAVNPKDERYAKYVGTEIEAEDLNGPIKLKVIADNHVDPEFGTGVVKVTPAHDPNDWAMGERHHLEVKQVIGTDGLLTELAGKYAGMPVAEARAQVSHDLEERGLMDHIDMNYTHSVGYHDRCGTLIEPLTVEQWWLSVDELKKPAIKAIKDGDIQFVPTRFKKVALDWLENLHDWNISRQNWWGIRIPVFYNSSSDTTKPAYIVTSDEAEAIKIYGADNYEAETDNFDTWFSSGQWPFATLMATDDFDRFYPTSVMETGRDILFLWVTRMVMFGLYRTGEVPFRTVYLHGLVTDGSGKKMSKSKGNVINPLEMTDKFGTDALRLALTIGITPGNDGALSEAKIEGYRNFCNKLWNVARFILGQLPDDYLPNVPQIYDNTYIFDNGIMLKLSDATNQVTNAIEEFRFSDAGQIVYSLLWNDFADVYLEAVKSFPSERRNHDLLIAGLETILKLAHPFAPFVTEAIWGSLTWQKEQLITTAWPELTKQYSADPQITMRYSELIESLRKVRSAIADEQLSRPELYTHTPMFAGAFGNSENQMSEAVSRLAKAKSITYAEPGEKLPSGFYVDTRIFIAAEPQVVVARHQRLEDQKKEKRSYLKSLDAKLGNPSYTDNAPAKVVQETRDRREETLMLLSKLDEQLQALEG